MGLALADNNQQMGLCAALYPAALPGFQTIWPAGHCSSSDQHRRNDRPVRSGYLFYETQYRKAQTLPGGKSETLYPLYRHRLRKIWIYFSPCCQFYGISSFSELLPPEKTAVFAGGFNLLGPAGQLQQNICRCPLSARCDFRNRLWCIHRLDFL